MAWYKMTCQHGPGHHSSSVEFCEAKNIREAKERLIDWVDEHQHRTWSIAEVALVKRFRKKDKVALIRKLHSEARYCRRQAAGLLAQVRRLEARKDN